MCGSVVGKSIEQKHAKMWLFFCVHLGAFFGCQKRVIMSQNMTKGQFGHSGTLNLVDNQEEALKSLNLFRCVFDNNKGTSSKHFLKLTL